MSHTHNCTATIACPCIMCVEGFSWENTSVTKTECRTLPETFKV